MVRATLVLLAVAGLASLVLGGVVAVQWLFVVFGVVLLLLAGALALVALLVPKS